MANNRITMEGIAAQLGISKNAVSLALRGKDGISDSLRARIMETAAAMNYVGVRPAKAQGCVLALIPKRLATPDCGSFYQQVCFDMEAYAQSKGFQLIFSSVSMVEEEVPHPPSLLDTIPCIGLMTIGNLSRPYCKMISELGLRYVMVDQYYDGLVANSVTTANTSGAYALTEYLIQHGHRNIQFFGTRFRTASLNDRWTGYCRAMEDYRLPVLSNAFTQKRVASDVDERALIRDVLTDMNEMPTAIVCGHEYNARDIIEFYGERGLRCPDDVSVVGFDNLQSPDVLALHLTTYHTPKTSIATTAIDLFLSMENHTPRRVCIFGEIICRDSVLTLGEARIHSEQ